MKITPRDDTSPEEKAAQERFRLDHVELLRMVKELTREERPEALAAAADALFEHLVAHFREEEGEFGIFKQVERARPEFEPRLAGLKAQHRELLGLVQHLGQLASTDGGSTEDTIAARDLLLAKLRSHEATETRLVTDSVYQDLGVGG